ncbi:MAG: hypothetical protein LQ341_005427 [Variospora aurantia]|nr:MAG: hypothetical protein LQ341_005427 [Variospora aurantia]
MNVPAEDTVPDSDTTEQPRAAGQQGDDREDVLHLGVGALKQPIGNAENGPLRNRHTADAEFWKLLAAFACVMLFAMALKWLGGTSSVNNEPISGSPETPLKLWCFGPGDEDAFRLPGFTPLASAFDPMDFATTINKLPEFLPPHSLPGGATSRDLLLNLVELASTLLIEKLPAPDWQQRDRAKLVMGKDMLHISVQLRGLSGNVADLQSLYGITISACYRYNFTTTSYLKEVQSKFTWHKLVDNTPPLIWQYIPDTVAGKYGERLRKTLRTLEEIQSATAALEHASYELFRIRQRAEKITEKVDDMAAQLGGDGSFRHQNQTIALFPDNMIQKPQGSQRSNVQL